MEPRYPLHPWPDTRERGTEMERAETAAGWLRSEFAEWPWFVSVAIETGPVRLIVFVAVPVDAPGDLFTVVDGLNVFRRQAPCC